MQKIALLAACVTVFISGCEIASPGIKGSGSIVKELRKVEAFDKVSLDGAGNIEIQIGNTDPLCEVECDDNLLEYLSTEVVDGELKIRFLKSVFPTKIPRVRLESEHLAKLKICGSTQVNVEGLNEPNVELSVSGSARIQCLGRAESLTATANGTATFNCFELVAEVVTIKIAGSGKAEVHANRKLDVEIAGSGEVRYLGSPEISEEILGSGSVRLAEK